MVNDISYRSIDRSFGRSVGRPVRYVYMHTYARLADRRFDVRAKPDGRVDNGNVGDSSR